MLYRIADDGVSPDPCTQVAPSACDDDSGSGSQAKLDEQLPAGTYYYINGDGTLTASNTGKGAGYALSASQIAIAPPPQ